MSPVFIISGIPGSGKSTVARALLRKFDKGIHISLDDLRESVVSGLAQPIPKRTEETTRQFHLAFKSGSQIANNYAEAGFAVAIHQVLYPHDVTEHLEVRLKKFKPVKVFLNPSLEVCIKRNNVRNNKDFDTSSLDDAIKAMHPAMKEQMAASSDWIVIDTSHQSVEYTVNDIIEKAGLALETNK